MTGREDVDETATLAAESQDPDERIARIEARQRDHDMHDPDCPVRQTQKAQRHTGMHLTPGACNCWLSDERTS